MNPLDIQKLRCYRDTDNKVLLNTGFRQSTDDRLKSFGVDLPKQKKNEVMTHIFAVDPRTGLPKSDIAYIYSQDSSPEISQYIQQNIMRPISQAVTGSKSPDDAIAAVRYVGESFEAFADRLKETFSVVDDVESEESE